jgi:SAM-dependent methyltransferase
MLAVLLRKLLKIAIPAPIRRSRFRQLVDHVARDHNAVYDKGYYDADVEGAAAKAAPVMAETICRRFQPKTVIDVGCGTGALLAAFRECNCGVLGLEYADAGLDYCKRRGLPVRKFKIGSDKLDAERCDLALSFEVAEHLSPWLTDKFVDLLCALSPMVVMSAATPGQGGLDHINERPHSYWAEKFRRRSYDLDADSTNLLRSAWKQAGVASWYCENVMCFARCATRGRDFRARRNAFWRASTSRSSSDWSRRRLS